MKILVFGSLVDLLATSSFEYDVVLDTNALLQKLTTDFPLLKDKKYALSVDKKIISDNTPLHNQAEIALLPPFSGG